MTSCPRIRALLTCSALLLGVAGCSAKGGNSAGPSTTAGGRDRSTTTAAGDETSTTTSTTTPTRASTTTTTTAPDETTTAPAPTEDPTVADLEALLPAAADVGTGWTIEAPSGGGSEEPDALDRALEEQCAEFAALSDDPANDDDSNEASRTFSAADGREIEVSLTVDGERELVGLDQAIAAIDSCSVSVDDEGTSLTMEFDAAADGSRGDEGIRIDARLTVANTAIPDPVELAIHLRVFAIDGVSVMVSTTDGLAEDTLAVTASDPAQFDDLSDLMENRVNDLLGN